jgi:hypothetical protein
VHFLFLLFLVLGFTLHFFITFGGAPLLFFYFFPSEMPILGAREGDRAEDWHFRREKIEEEKGALIWLHRMLAFHFL